MVDNVTSLTGNGLKDWLLQRFSAVFIGIYTVFLLSFIMLHTPLTYPVWHGLFQNTLMRIASVTVLFLLILHAWIGIWTVSTDYVKNTFVRISLQALIAIGFIGLLIWGIDIFWG